MAGSIWRPRRSRGMRERIRSWRGRAPTAPETWGQRFGPCAVTRNRSEPVLLGAALQSGFGEAECGECFADQKKGACCDDGLCKTECDMACLGKRRCRDAFGVRGRRKNLILQ